MQYVSKWPDFCRKCNGTGLIIYEDDPSPAGVALSPGTMDFEEPCSGCVENGICPRCGKEVWPVDIDWPQPCGNCGWEEKITEGVIDEPQCICR